MEHIFQIAALWIGLALAATALGSLLKVSNALTEIIVGIAAGAVASRFFGEGALGADETWLKFIASTGAVMLTFLAGAELDPGTMHAKWKEVIIVGLVGFAAPFLGCAALAHFALGWSAPSAWLAGIALSTTSMAVVYAVMLETGFNRTDFGKGILGACFVNDLGTVIALGLVFSPFTWRTAAFVAGSAAALALLPIVTPRLARRYANRTAAFRTKWVLFVLFGLGAGISREGCLVDMGSDENIVEKTGAWYSFEETRIGQGRENAKEFLRANPDIAQRIERKILDKHGVKTANGKSQAPAAPADAATPSTADDKPQKPAKKG